MGLEKDIMLGIIPRKHWQGGQKNQWMDDNGARWAWSKR